MPHVTPKRKNNYPTVRKMKHGLTNSRTFRAWTEMNRRCRNPKSVNFKHYGARGITICERWLDFRNFLADMGLCPDGLELDRIDPQGHYESSNCRWATELQQQNNRTNNVKLQIGSIVHTVSEWARSNGVRTRTAAQRIRAGWPPELAVSRPADKVLQWRR